MVGVGCGFIGCLRLYLAVTARSAAASPYRHVVTSAACACSRGAVLCRSRVSHRGQLTPSLPAAVCARERRRAATSQEQQPLSSSLHASNGKASCQADRAVQEAGTAKCSELETSATSLNVVTIVFSIAHLILFVRQPELFDNEFARVGFCATDRGWLHTLEYTFLFQLAAVLVLLSLAIANPSSGFSAEAIKQVPGILFHALAHLAQVREVPVISFFTKSMAANNEHSVYDLMETRVEAVQHVVFFTLFFSSILASSMGSHTLWYSLLVTLAQLFVPWKLILLYVSTAILVGKCVASISDMGDTLPFRLTAVRNFAILATAVIESLYCSGVYLAAGGHVWYDAVICWGLVLIFLAVLAEEARTPRVPTKKQN